MIIAAIGSNVDTDDQKRFSYLLALNELFGFPFAARSQGLFCRFSSQRHSDAPLLKWFPQELATLFCNGHVTPCGNVAVIGSVYWRVKADDGGNWVRAKNTKLRIWQDVDTLFARLYQLLHVALFAVFSRW